MFDSYSSRLKICRAITNLSPRDIVEEVNKRGIEFSYKQYSRWEKKGAVDTSRIIKEAVIECIVDIFNGYGLPDLSSEWLLHGKGMPPFLVDMSNALEEEKAFYISKAMGKEYKLTTIASNYGEPFASPGEQIITRKALPEKLENKLAFVETNEHGLYLGILNNLQDSISINNLHSNNTILKSNIQYCGRVTWIS